MCQQLSLEADCPKDCTLDTWDLSVRVTDRDDGMGVERVSLKQGSGVMTTSLDPDNGNITLVSYNASCCSPNMELQVVDRVGNVGTCFFSSEEGVTSPVSMSTKVTYSVFLCLTMVLLEMYMSTVGVIQLSPPPTREGV